MKIIFLLLSMSLFSCKYDHSKWQTTEKKATVEGTVENAIYFQDSLIGIIGGFKLVKNIKSKNIDKLDCIPVIYLTKDGGNNWDSINIKKFKEGSVDNLYFSGDTITCQIDTLVLKSNDLGQNWNLIEKSNYMHLSEKYFPNANRYNIPNPDFKFDNKKYSIKESYKYKNVKLIVCYGEEHLTDYYFISRDNGKKWSFLQDEFGSNRKKFLLKGKYIIAYHFFYGLQKIKINPAANSGFKKLGFKC